MAAKESEKSQCKQLLVAAFDFGTTFSGYAFSFRDDPMKIQSKGWNAGSEKLLSLKAPTCVLLTPDQQFHSFGFEAENKYADLAEDDEHHGWMLFRRFKMLLHNNKGLHRDVMVEDINRKKVQALKIFSMAIRYLKDHLVKAVETQTGGVKETDIEYVVTVPAIWNDAAKQFMKEAAVMGGLDKDRLKLALEPEVASIWCQHITSSLKQDISKTGSRYMVVDLGGGTADISVHEKNLDGTLKEIHKASGGPWGGTTVDQNYINWLAKVFGKHTLETFQREQMTDFFDMLREFETKKRNVTPETEGKITFRVAASLKEIFNKEDTRDIEETLTALKLNEKVTYKGDKLRVEADIVKEWFAGPINETIGHIKTILHDPKLEKVNAVIVVGGFGECELVHGAFRSALGTMNVVIPDEAGLAVLKGAVRFGHFPRLVDSRVLQYTFGVGVRRLFNERLHPRSKIKVINGKEKVNGVFAKIVEINQEVKLGSTIKLSRPIHSSHGGTRTKTKADVYSSLDENPVFVSDPNCSKVGTVNIPVDHTNDEKKYYDVYFEFGETEMKVTVKIKDSDLESSAYFDCL